MTTNSIATISSGPGAGAGAGAGRKRGLRLLAALAVVIAVAALTLAPRAFVAPVKALFLRGMEVVSAPLMALIPAAEADRIMNTLLFVPLGATIAMLLGRRAWPVALFAGFALSLGVELFQTSIPGRVPDAEDVLWNTVGGAIGVFVVVGIRMLGALVTRVIRARRASQPASVTRT